MSNTWYYATADKPLGPVTEPQIKKLAASGRLEPFHRVWSKGMVEWEPAGSVAALTGSHVISSGSPAAQEWYYGSGGKKHGPVSFARLQRLVIDGKIEASDLLWTDAWDDWKRASDVEEIREALLPPIADPNIPMPPLGESPTSLAPAVSEMPSTNEIPPIPVLSNESQPTKTTSNRDVSTTRDESVRLRPNEKRGIGANAKTWLSGLVTNTMAAGKLVGKQAERTKLTNVMLPTAYRELGRYVHSHGQFREEFPAEFQSIDDLERKLQEIETSAKQTGEPQGAGGRAKALAESAKAAANRKVLEQKRGQAFAALGKVVFEKHGPQAGPEELVGQVANLRSRLELLDAEIVELSQAGRGQVYTPKRIAIGGMVVIAVCLLLLAKSMLLPGVYKAESLWALSEQEADALEGKWITVEGEVTNARYFPNGAPMMFLQENKSMIVMKNDSGGEVSFEFDGPDSGGINIDSLSRGDWISVKGKVYVGTEKVVGLRLCEIVSGP